MRGEEEFCVATSACEHATWRKAFDKHKSLVDGFELPMSLSHCDVWGDLNRCDGALCDVDHECQSGCCGAFVSFTHHRCLPILGDYCAARDKTRKYSHHNKPVESKDQTKLQVLAQNNENGIKPCHMDGDKDLCDEMVCEFDAHCRSGCCT